MLFCNTRVGQLFLRWARAHPGPPWCCPCLYHMFKWQTSEYDSLNAYKYSQCNSPCRVKTTYPIPFCPPLTTRVFWDSAQDYSAIHPAIVFFGLIFGLLLADLFCNILLDILSSIFLCTWTAHLIVAILISFNIPDCPESCCSLLFLLISILDHP